MKRNILARRAASAALAACMMFSLSAPALAESTDALLQQSTAAKSAVSVLDEENGMMEEEPAYQMNLKYGSIRVYIGDDGKQYAQQGENAPQQRGNLYITTDGGPTDNTLTIEGGTTGAKVTLSNVKINASGAAVSVSGNVELIIAGTNTNTLRSGTDHAGVEKADDNGTLTISGTGTLEAYGGQGGAGIGGGLDARGSGDVTVSGDAKLKVRGGKTGDDGQGAGIGNGGVRDQNGPVNGTEVEPDICALNPSGKIEYYAPGSVMTGTPSKTVTNPTGDHAWDSGRVTKPATCTEKGVKTYTCTRHSSHTKNEEIPALNHSFDGQEYVSDNNATCGQDGTKTIRCVRYGTGGCTETDTVTDTGSKLGHLFEDYVSNNDATYAHDGTKTAKCVRYDQCGETHTMPDEGSRLIAPPLYRVTDKDGRDIAYTAEQKGGVLTVTVDEDFAVLTSSLSGMTALRAQGIEKIIFVTNGAKTAVKLSTIISKLTANGVFHLTHDGKAATFTLG